MGRVIKVFILFLGLFFAFNYASAQKKTALDSLKYTTSKGAYLKLVGKTKGVYQKKLDSVTLKVYAGNTLFYSNYFPRGFLKLLFL